jgi:hypothetical protein
MHRRLKLHEEFCEILGSRYVYFQPPMSVQMHYPAIRYSIAGAYQKHADDTLYAFMMRYEVTVIDANPETEIPWKLLSHFSKCSFDRHYVSDKLNHFVFTLYY